MRNLIERLTENERRAATVLAALCAFGLLAFFYASIQERPAAVRLEERRSEIERDFRRLSPEWERSRAELALWREAARDMAELKRTRFYAEARGFQDLQLDLQALFDAVRAAVDDISFSYSDFPKEGIRTVQAAFTFRGSYAGLKELLGLVERHPRFLALEKVDFQDIGTAPGILVLKITMVAYYAR